MLLGTPLTLLRDVTEAIYGELVLIGIYYALGILETPDLDV